MPYITQSKREALLSRKLRDVVKDIDLSAGDLNFIISSLLSHYFKYLPSYAKINEIVGLLECIKLEFYRREASIYEDLKMAENGDIGL